MTTVAITEATRAERAARWVRIACIVGAVTDAGAAVQMLSPRVFAFAYRPHALPAREDYVYAMGMGASLMLGWTALLLWAALRPLECRGVLLLTVVPVIAGLVANEIVAVANGFLPLGPLVPIWILQFVLSALFAFSYGMAERAVRSRQVAPSRDSPGRFESPPIP
jgi:hypothetical protein